MGVRLPGLLVVAALACLAVGGQPALGKLALLAGRYELAARWLPGPGARGVALYHLGRYQAADAAFREAGRSATYNRGLSLAVTGDYPLAVAYFDAVLFATPQDHQARDNRQRVAALIEQSAAATDAPGRIAALVAGAEAAHAQAHPPNPNVSTLQQKAQRRGLVATDAWLDTLADAPGEYLQKRLRAEYQRRAEQGLVVTDEARPW